jgi:ATP-dependent Lon protease
VKANFQEHLMGLFKKEKDQSAETDNRVSHLDEYYKKVGISNLPEHVSSTVNRELAKLEKTDSTVAEYSIGLNYIDFILSLPWGKLTEDKLDLERAERVLDDEHMGLAQVKERVLEHLATTIKCQSKPYKIMVVDDEPIALENLSYTLRKEGYDVSTASNGKEALDLFNTDSFDLVVTDLKMQKMSGVELLEAVHKISTHTRFIITTGYATVESAVEALKKGAAHYLPKPVKLDTLKATVRELVQQNREYRTPRGSVLCFSGPPGIGKTSVGRSIANAFGRLFVCLSMAGLRDEAELRGHRRTYVGAMPGRILSEIQKAGFRNPVFMLDELDKIGQDFRGDPASVLLEVLDPSQNGRFLDYYLDIPFDLSEVLFITTANDIDMLPKPLLDRMEIIHFSGYTISEKKKIARHYLIPRQLKAHGLEIADLSFSDDALTKVIFEHTREAGLRNLEREIARICRKTDRLLFQKKINLPATIDKSVVEDLLGAPKFKSASRGLNNIPGVTTGLVWTEFGGQIIFVETAIMKGNRNLVLTGSLGEVLKESAQTALSYVRSSAEQFGINEDFYSGCDIHIHIPAGAIPKDGPSAGITIAVALISLLTRKPCQKEIAMTGELTLSGTILPVSGIREKILAAQQSGIKTVILPESNKTDFNLMEPEVREAVDVIFADSIPAVINHILEKDEAG